MASTQPTLRCVYRYDPLDRLIKQTQPDTPALQRFYCKSRLATEIQDAVKHSIFQQGDQLLAQQQRPGDALSTTLLATDLQRSILQTLTENHKRHPIAYSPYGHHRAGTGLISLLRFNGERPDPVTGHYLLGNGYRAFNPLMMRFNSTDSWSPFGMGGLNGYAYCIGNPITNSDPSGHFISPLKVLAIGNKWRTIAANRNILPKTELFQVNRLLLNITRLNTEVEQWVAKVLPSAAPLPPVKRSPINEASNPSLTGYVNVKGKIATGKKANPNATLQDLAYSSIEGRDLRKVYEHMDLPNIDDTLNAGNLLNEVANIRRRHPYDIPERTRKLQELKTAATTGNIRGIHPASPYLSRYDPKQ